MSGGSIVLVSYGEENMFLSYQPQISYFKIIYRRYTNFSIETILTDFLNVPNFNNVYSASIPKYADLMHKSWLVIELPEIPVLLNFNGEPNNKLKTAWARNIGYVLVKSIEIVIGNSIIQKTWGEYLQALDEFNFNNYNSPLNQYIGNVPQLYKFQPANTIREKYILYIPFNFWFCNSASQALPLISLDYDDVIFNVQFNSIEQCLNVSPTNYIQIQQFYGSPIFNEPLVQFSNQGVAWATFDTLDSINTENNPNFFVSNSNLYYRKISNQSFTTTDLSYYDKFNTTDVLNDFFNLNKPTKYFIYGLWSKSIFIPISNETLTSNNLEKTYIYKPFQNTLRLGRTYLLIDYIFLDKQERVNFFNNKHEYIIEQVYYTGEKITNNLTDKINLELINPCSYYIFMAQLSYMTNQNVNDHFNYTNTFIRDRDTQKTIGLPLIKQNSLLLNSQTITGERNMDFYNLIIPFLKFPKCYYPNGMGVYSFSLYPFNIQQSGTCNLSTFSNISFLNRYKITDLNNNNYIFKSYFVTTNILKIIHGVGATVFYSNY